MSLGEGSCHASIESGSPKDRHVNNASSSSAAAITASPKVNPSTAVTSVRRDSNWTVSTEGYGSMRSDQQSATASSVMSRRCSEISGMSQVIRAQKHLRVIPRSLNPDLLSQSFFLQGSNLSTRANANSPWDPPPVSSGSSRRSSMAADGTGQISSHINRLHRKAQQTMQSPVPPGMSQSHDFVSSGRQSAMSDVTDTANNQGNGFATPRRASDPVRTLDRNFGVSASNGSSMSRHRSYSQLNNVMQRPAINPQGNQVT